MRDTQNRLSCLSALLVATACGGSTGAAPVGAPAPVAAPKAFAYAPSASQFRFTSSAKITQSAMGQSQDMETSAMRLLSVTVARAAADTLSLNVVIDSVSGLGPMGMPVLGLETLVGAKFAAKVSPSGAVYAATGPSEATLPMAAALTEEMARLLPRIKAILAPGATWTDTISDKPKQGGLELNRQIVSHFTVIGDSTANGEAAWKIARESATTASGTGAPQGQNVVLETAGTGKGVILISKRGVLLGGESEEQSTGKVTLTANGMEIGLKSTTTTKVLKVK